MKERVLKAFFHRGRKAFVPWTVEEIARRVKERSDKVSAVMMELNRSGLAGSMKTHQVGIHSWHLTEAGKAIALSIITAEDFVKGGNA